VAYKHSYTLGANQNILRQVQTGNRLGVVSASTKGGSPLDLLPHGIVIMLSYLLRGWTVHPIMMCLCFPSTITAYSQKYRRDVSAVLGTASVGSQHTAQHPTAARISRQTNSTGHCATVLWHLTSLVNMRLSHHDLLYTRVNHTAVPIKPTLHRKNSCASKNTSPSSVWSAHDASLMPVTETPTLLPTKTLPRAQRGNWQYTG
jgi:hypothetical protein